MRFPSPSIPWLGMAWGSHRTTFTIGKYQTVTVTSQPPGVKVRAETGEYIETPGRFNLLRNEDHILVADYSRAEPQRRQIKRGLRGWFFGNILLGDLPGGVAYLASGSSHKLTPNTVHFNFSSAGQAAAKRQREYLEAHSDVKPEVQVAIENQMAVKGMTTEQLIASLGAPDQMVPEGCHEKLTYDNRKPKCYLFKNGTLEKTE